MYRPLYSIENCVENLEQFIRENGKATRDSYRVWPKAIPEKSWRKHFPTFQALLGATKNDNFSTEDSQVFESDTWTINIPKTRLHTLEEVLEQYKVDTSVWQVERFKVGNYELGMKPPATTEYVQTKDGRTVPMWVRFENEPVIVPLYRIEVSFTKRKEILAAIEEIEKLREQLKKDAPFCEWQYDGLEFAHDYDNMLEIDIPDAHFGKMAWHKETGSRSYDTPIAAATFLRALNNLLQRATVGGLKFNRILLVVGNDLLNSDNEQGTTTKGTFVSTDGRYQKTFVTVRETITEAINLCKEIAPVYVVMVSGNHDDLGVWHLGDSLQGIFGNDENVTIDNEPKYRKYVRYGNTLLMFTHGDKGKREDYPLLMATEQSQDFGETMFREVHTGHIHQTKLQEWHGVRVRILPSLSPPDAWHAENGFTGQQRNAEAFVWNFKEGLIAQYFHNDDVYPEITTDRILKEG